jgi:D-alanyl-lipoteichoic acid acyltransferase DltB (MBOAT superfamily)
MVPGIYVFLNGWTKQKSFNTIIGVSFVSWQYALFLPAMVLVYWQLPWRGRIFLLLAGSYFFYGMWDARFLALLLTTTIVDFFGALAIVGRKAPAAKVIGVGLLPLGWLLGCEAFYTVQTSISHWIIFAAAFFSIVYGTLYQLLWRLPLEKQRLAFLVLSLCSNLSVLGVFKYFNFFAGSLAALLGKLGGNPGWTLLHIILPIGVSFYTFQSISYAVDVYRGVAKPSDDFFTFAAFVSFFPQLVSGPIERCNDLLPQLQKPARFEIANIHRGLRLILIGLFKKFFVADNCALLANYAFDSKTTLNGQWALLGVLAFAFQIYGDFSGYTDIARGSARLLGIHLNRNFNFPYFAASPSDFWRRWHITLSLWFRDYVYIPLGGNRHGVLKTFRNLWITMLLAGLWHGANWTFVLWGAYYAALLTLYHAMPGLNRLTAPQKNPGWRIIISVPLMFIFTLIGWAIFRSKDPTQLASWVAAFGNWNFAAAADWEKPCWWWLLHIVPLLLLQVATWKARDEVEFAYFPWPVRGLIYAILFLLVVSSVAPDVEFIYFQF